MAFDHEVMDLEVRHVTKKSGKEDRSLPCGCVDLRYVDPFLDVDFFIKGSDVGVQNCDKRLILRGFHFMFVFNLNVKYEWRKFKRLLSLF